MNFLQTLSLPKNWCSLKRRLLFYMVSPFYNLKNLSFSQHVVMPAKQTYNSLLSLGVYEEMPVYEMQRVRFSNFIGLFCQSFYASYLLLSYIIESRFLALMIFSMLITGFIGFLLNKYRHYNLARSMFITSFSVLLFFICQIINN